MIVLLMTPNDEGWLGYIRDGHYVTVTARTREEACITLLKKLEKLGLPPPAPDAFNRPTSPELAPGATDGRKERPDDDL
jgi:hypothetical protein